MRQKPNANAVRSLEAVLQVQSECPRPGALCKGQELPFPPLSKGTRGRKDHGGALHPHGRVMPLVKPGDLGPAYPDVACPAGKYWVALQRFASKLGCSFLEAQHHEAEEVETVTALASLSVAVMVEKR